MADAASHRLAPIALTLAALAFSILSARAGELTLSCTPHFKYLCGNIHVDCAGKSRIKAPFLQVRTRNGEAQITTDDDQLWRGTVSHSDAILIRFDDQAGYLKIAPDQSFSLRVYRQGRAYMSRGRCD